MNMVKKSICGLTSDEIFDLIRQDGFTFLNALSITTNVYKKHKSDISLFEKIPKALKELLSKNTESGIFYPKNSFVSEDKSVKYLFVSESGKAFETVYIPEGRRHTVCVSTQSGCRMGCTFCATAKYGFNGNLSSAEIVNQIIAIPQADKVTHVVFMGMGEPMDNLENVLKACKIITAEWGMALSPRNITVSTVGILPGVEEFLNRSDCNMTFSLYSPFSDERLKGVPIEKLYPFHKILDIMTHFKARKGRRLSIAYIMIKDVNDTDSHLYELISTLRGSSIRVNLIPFHSHYGHHYFSSSEERMQYFKHNLVISGISASIRKSRGTDISAACGLLAAFGSSMC
jgi:23S rRNA (adenine2503-C2)-methyltransferase